VIAAGDAGDDGVASGGKSQRRDGKGAGTWYLDDTLGTATALRQYEPAAA
jgi:hypothetical protein